MRLTTHTDFGLRLLMYGAVQYPRPVTIDEAAAKFNASRHHLMKVAQNLTKAGWVEPVRGRSGGFRLAVPTQEITLGQVVRTLEPEMGLVECMREKSSDCPIIPSCRLPRILNEATQAFFQVLDKVTLHDLIQDNHPLIRTLEVAS